MHVRQATVFDIDSIAPLLDGYRQFYGQASDMVRGHKFLVERFAHQQSVVFIAFDEGESAVGFTQLYPMYSTVRTTRTYVLNDLFVATGVRRRRVGEKLLAAAVEFARANGAASLSLQTAVDNHQAQSLYETLGWKRDERFYEYTFELNS